MSDAVTPVAPGPALAVVIATRGAAEGVVRAVASVLRSTRADFEVCVVHQSDADLSWHEAMRDSRVRIVYAPDRGLAMARNIGAAHTTAPLVAFTDDDCEVDSDWLDGFARAFGADSRLGVVFGTVRASAYDRRTGFIQAYEVQRLRVALSVSQQWSVNGIGACLAVRRTVLDRLDGFDERFGAGAALRAAEDNDLALRALAAGHSVSETPDAIVTHFGFRTWAEAGPLIESYMFGLGAMHAKMVRIAGLSAFRPTVTLGWRWLVSSPAADMNHRPPRGPRLAGFLRGVARAWKMPIDPVTNRFTTRQSRTDPVSGRPALGASANPPR